MAISSSRGSVTPGPRSRRGSVVARARQQADRADRERRSRESADARQQHALGEQLPDQPSRRRADGTANGDLVIARGRARQQQVGDVHARDQQHQADRAGQHEQRRLHRSHELVLHAGDLEAPGRPPAARMIALIVVLGRPQARRRRRRRASVVRLKKAPPFGSGGTYGIQYWTCASGNAKPSGITPTTVRPRPSKRGDAADDRRIAVEVALPRRVTQDDDGVGAGRPLRAIRTDDRASAARPARKHRRGHLDAGEADRVALPGQRRAGQDVAGDVRQRARPRAQRRRSTAAAARGRRAEWRRHPGRSAAARTPARGDRRRDTAAAAAARALMTLKIAVLAPMPSASVSTAIAVKPGVRRSDLRPCAMSRRAGRRSRRTCARRDADPPRARRCRARAAPRGAPRPRVRPRRRYSSSSSARCDVDFARDLLIRAIAPEDVRADVAEASHGVTRTITIRSAAACPRVRRAGASARPASRARARRPW